MVLTETACNRVTSAQTRGPLACGLEAGNHARGNDTMKTFTAIFAAAALAMVSIPASGGERNGNLQISDRAHAFNYPHNSGISDRWGNGTPGFLPVGNDGSAKIRDASSRRVRHSNGDCNTAMCGVSTTR